jgi:hypothetical protein
MKVYSITEGDLSHARTSIAHSRDCSKRKLSRDGTADPRRREACHARGVETGHQTMGRANARVPALWCQVPEKLNIKVRVNKGQLADHDLWHSDQATVDLTLRVAGLDYKN